jgi:hypothetical protein
MALTDADVIRMGKILADAIKATLDGDTEGAKALENQGLQIKNNKSR